MKVDRRNTSQMCGVCGRKSDKAVGPPVHTYRYDHCGHSDRPDERGAEGKRIGAPRSINVNLNRYALTLAIVTFCITFEQANARSFLYDEFDEFTDERELAVAMKEVGLSDGHLIFQCHKDRGMIVAIKPGDIMFHLEQEIEVNLRFDRDLAQTIAGIYDDFIAFLFNGKKLLNSALKASRLLAIVGKSKKMTFDLESARDHLVTFAKRCDQWIEQPS